jgi:hypothetical protein
MGRKIKESYDGRLTRAQREFQEKIDRAREASGRAKCSLLRVWRHCRKAACRRAHACLGDMDECFQLNWQALPEAARVWLRAGMKARAQGLSLSQAVDAAEAEMARAIEETARYEAAFPAGDGPVARAARETAEANRLAAARRRYR